MKRVNRATDAAAAYVGLRWDSPLLRACPKCGSQPGHRCVTMRRAWPDAIKYPHRERRRHVEK